MNLKGVKIFTSLVLVIIVIGSLYSIFRDRKVTNYPSSGRTIIAFGDSLIEGVGSTHRNDLVSLLSQKLNVPILNAGVSGNTTAQGLERLQKDVLDKDPKVVLVLLGGNDFLRRIPKEVTFSNLQEIVDRIHEKGAVVVLLGIRGGIIRDTYKADFDAFAKRNNVAYVSNVLDDVLGNKELMYDSIHPNDLGYAHIAKRVAPILEKVVK